MSSTSTVILPTFVSGVLDQNNKIGGITLGAFVVTLLFSLACTNSN